MTRKQEILNKIQSLLRRNIEIVTAIEEYVGELECIDNYERLNHVKLDNVLSTEPSLKKEEQT